MRKQISFTNSLLTASGTALIAVALTSSVNAAPANVAPAKTAARSTPVAPAALPSLNGWEIQLAEEELESTWSWRTRLEATGPFESRIVLHQSSPQDYLMLRIVGDAKNATMRFWRVTGGRIEKFGEADAPLSKLSGQLTVQRSPWRVRALWNGRVLVTAYSNVEGHRFGTATQGSVTLLDARMQPTEPPVLRDDFMRAQGPDEPEVPGEWRVKTGVWKTSGLLEPRADAAANPNPFVFRAEAVSGGKSTTAIAVASKSQKWFWSDYSVMASVRPELQTVSAPLVAGIAAYVQPDGASVVGSVDFRSGIASISVGGTTVASSKPFAAETDQWHRLFLDPGPGTLRLVVDGVERVRFDTTGRQDLAQGEAALHATVGGGNHVDFDDVRVGANDATSDDFRTAAVGRWEDAVGEWQTRTAQGQRIKLTSAPALTLTGSAEREEGVVEAAFAAPKTASVVVPVGVAFAARDARNYFTARLRTGQLEVVEYSDGVGKILANLKIAKAVAAPTIVVEWREGLITARAAGAEVTATTSTPLTGRVGAWADGAAGAVALTSFRALGAAPGWGEAALSEKFTKDRLMQYWASNAAAWKVEAGSIPMDAKVPTAAERAVALPAPAPAEKTAPEKPAQNVYRWHTGDFFRDATVALPLPAFEANSTLMILVSTDPGKPGDAGASLLIERAASALKFTLSEGGSMVKTRTLPLPQGEEKRQLRFVRRLLGEGKVLLRLAVSQAGGETQVLFSETATAKAPPKIQAVSTDAANAGVISEATKIGVRPIGIANFDWEKVTADTGNRLDYTFTTAPVDWYASKGRWEMAERWTCTPQWGFFQGGNAINPTLWSRFGLRGDYTVEAYLATPMDHTRGERSPIDLNVTVDGDGHDLASGYSFMFGANSRRSNHVVRGDEVVWEQPFKAPPGAGNTHQDWFYVRIERRQTPQGLRFRYSVNGREVTTYIDNDAPEDTLTRAGRVAFWTYNGALSIARVRVWHNGVENVTDTAPSQVPTLLADTAKSGGKNALGEWQARQDGVAASTARLQLVNEDKRKALKVVNPTSGGDWTVYVTRTPFDAAQHSKISFNYRVPSGVLVNLYAKIDGRWREILFTADPSQPPLRQGRFARAQKRQAAKGATPPVDASMQLGRIEGVVADDKWHTATFDLLTPLKNANLNTKIEALAFAAPDREYLRTGIGGNHLGATYWLSDFTTSAATTPLPAIAAVEKKQ